MRSRHYTLLALIVLLSLVLLTLQIPGREIWDPGRPIAWLTHPLQALLTRVQRATLSLWTAYGSWKDLRVESRSLREEVERLRLESLQVTEIVEENQRLRRLLALKERLPLETIPGEVIGKEWGGWVRSLTVNRGGGDGIARLTPVIVPQGVVGRVLTVRGGAAVIQLINDPSSSLGAMVQRTRVQGAVEGEPGGNLRLKYLAREADRVQVGDLVVTSGLAGLFPKGLPVGRVARLKEQPTGLFHYATIASSVDFARVEEVLLLLGRSPMDLSPYFPSG